MWRRRLQYTEDEPRAGSIRTAIRTERHVWAPGGGRASGERRGESHADLSCNDHGPELEVHKLSVRAAAIMRGRIGSAQEA